jgi:hypothetical protein
MAKPTRPSLNRSSRLYAELLCAFPCCEPASATATVDLVSGRTIRVAETVVDAVHGPVKRVANLGDAATYLKLPITISDGPPFAVPPFTAAAMVVGTPDAANLQVLNVNVNGAGGGPLAQVRTFPVHPDHFALTDYRSETYAMDPEPVGRGFAYVAVFVWDGTAGTWYGADGVTPIGTLALHAPQSMPVYLQPITGPGAHTAWAYAWGTALSAELRRLLVADPYDMVIDVAPAAAPAR